MKFDFGVAFTGLLAVLPLAIYAGDNDWESPVYTHFFEFPLPIPPTAIPVATYTNQTTGIPIDFYEIHIKSFQSRPYPELGSTTLVGYDGISPGPTFRITRGREALVRFINEYNRPSAIHLHGSYSRAPFDGWAEDMINPGQYKDYYFPNHQEGRTMWYHDHAMHITAVNAYYGQAGFYILTDPAEEARYRLPRGKYDVPLMLQSKRYQANGDLFSPAGETESLYGDVIHVNGQPWPYLKVEPRRYRFRLLDASVSRAFRLYFVESGTTRQLPFTVFASDAGFMSQPVTVTNMYMSIAERWEVLFDFTSFAGKNITLMNSRDVMKDDDFAGTDRVMRFVVGTSVTDSSFNNDPPSSLRTLNLPPAKSGVDHSFRFAKSGGKWTINGVTFADVANRILAKPQRGATELWQLENNSGGWSHPVHIHLVDFQIISREGGRGAVEPYERAALKDVVLLGRNEKVTVLARYAPWDGVYMFHCHNLVHEDDDMMGAFNVTALKDFGYPETTRFIDPMEQRWRAKSYQGTDLNRIRTETLPFFSSLDAYASVDEVDQAIKEYHRTRVEGDVRTTSTSATSSAPPASSSTSSTPAAPSTTPTSTRTTISSSTSTTTSSTRRTTTTSSPTRRTTTSSSTRRTISTTRRRASPPRRRRVGFPLLPKRTAIPEPQA
ncbi:Cupredoxin [Trichophaea hybrida]|nr:Cupredoxin [Trichophaea hybrida]